MMGNGRTIAFSTLGCKLNQFETDSIATRFEQAGYARVAFDAPADVYVINSCTVTNRSDRKSRNLLYRAERNRSQNSNESLVVLTGCFVDSHKDSLESDPRTFVVPNEKKHTIFDLVQAHFNGEIIAPSGSVFDYETPNRSAHTRTPLKVRDGCDNFCTFCIIPFVRGRAQSRPADEIVRSANEAVASGSRELVLTGVNMSRYMDGDIDFAALVEQLLTIDGEYRIRISSLEPDQLSDRFVELFQHERMVPHLHLCLQSASERILLAMRRQYTYVQYREIAEKLRRIDPLFNITTDLIVGFPGESDLEHAESLQAITELQFGHVHTFPYSLRTGTRAERMPDHLPARVKTERSRQIRELADTQKLHYRQRLVGTRQRVLVEQIDHDNGLAYGLSEYYIPIQFPVEDHSDVRLNTLWPVEVTSVDPDGEHDASGRLAPLRAFQ
jgi:threonylcarbamoyladenosine tRNA methylthiotransferase MtaB